MVLRWGGGACDPMLWSLSHQDTLHSAIVTCVFHCPSSLLDPSTKGKYKKRHQHKINTTHYEKLAIL